MKEDHLKQINDIITQLQQLGTVIDAIENDASDSLFDLNEQIKLLKLLTAKL
jgi:hypothetical protein